MKIQAQFGRGGNFQRTAFVERKSQPVRLAEYFAWEDDFLLQRISIPLAVVFYISFYALDNEGFLFGSRKTFDCFRVD